MKKFCFGAEFWIQTFNFKFARGTTLRSGCCLFYMQFSCCIKFAWNHSRLSGPRLKPSGPFSLQPRSPSWTVYIAGLGEKGTLRSGKPFLRPIPRCPRMPIGSTDLAIANGFRPFHKITFQSKPTDETDMVYKVNDHRLRKFLFRVTPGDVCMLLLFTTRFKTRVKSVYTVHNYSK